MTCERLLVQMKPDHVTDNFRLGVPDVVITTESYDVLIGGVVLSQPHFGLSVRVKPTFPKVGSWSPLGLPKIQSAIAGVKSPRI
jgi:hypothetical protein